MLNVRSFLIYVCISICKERRLLHSIAILVIDLSRPELKDLLNIVIPKVASNWYYLGIQLLNNSQVPKLDAISATYSTDLQRGCVEMFKHWLNITPGATWDNIICALRAPSLQLLSAADEVEKEIKGFKKFRAKYFIGNPLKFIHTNI